MGLYSNENSPFAIKQTPSPLISLDFLQKRVGVFSRGYGTDVLLNELLFFADLMMMLATCTHFSDQDYK